MLVSAQGQPGTRAGVRLQASLVRSFDRAHPELDFGEASLALAGNVVADVGRNPSSPFHGRHRTAEPGKRDADVGLIGQGWGVSMNEVQTAWRKPFQAGDLALRLAMSSHTTRAVEQRAMCSPPDLRT